MIIIGITGSQYNPYCNKKYVSYNNKSFQRRVSSPRNLNPDICNDIISGKMSKHFVPTPRGVILQMLKELGSINKGEKILEPSAGLGHIADMLVKTHNLNPGDIDVVEPAEKFRRELNTKGYNLRGYNILEYNPQEKYDKIIMNPPFDNGMEIKHVIKCFSLLKNGGKLITILPNSAFIPPRQTGYEKWMQDWFNTGEKREINEYLFELLKNNDSKIINLGKAFLQSDVPDDVETKLVVINKN